MGSSTSKAKSKYSNQSTQDYTDQFKPDVQRANQALNDAYSNSSNQAYSGDRVINGFNQGTQQSIDRTPGITQDQQSNAHSTDDLKEGTVNPYFSQALSNGLQQQKVSDLGNSAVAGYGTSDTANLISQNQSRAYTQAMNDQWNATQDRRLKAQENATQANLATGALNKDQMNAYGKADALNQAKLDAQRDQWNENQNLQWDNLAKYISGLRDLSAPTGTVNSSGKSSSKSSVDQPIGSTIAQTAGIGGSLFGSKGMFPGLSLWRALNG